MKNSRDVIILKKILAYCIQVNEACDMFHNDYNSFKGNSVFQNACCMCILQIGELCKVISDELRLQEKIIPWKEWCGIRDIFAHQYSNLDYESAWDTIQYDLPELKKEVERILKSNDAL
ncbi:MAG: DUF86 domain-containing protein [Butyrivibrio sp.]|nr:DUF86 domain-containing protein [Butyrivibrio sp.]